MSEQPPQRSRVLVIDDEPLVLGMVTRLLRRRYEVTATTSGPEGLRLALEEPFDAILCDVMLPELSGPQILQKLEELAPDTAAKLGFMTGGAFGPESSAFLEGLAPEEWLPKPFGLRQLEAFIERLLHRSDEPPEGGVSGHV